MNSESHRSRQGSGEESAGEVGEEERREEGGRGSGLNGLDSLEGLVSTDARVDPLHRCLDSVHLAISIHGLKSTALG